MFSFIEDELQILKNNSLYRKPKTIEKINGNRITIDDRELILFCSNNYLGLAQHPEVIQSAIEATQKFGTSSSASRLISGTNKIITELEKELAEFKNREAAIVFPSGYQANLGIISSLATEKDTIIIDRLNHASIIDGCKLTKAKLQVYLHKDIKQLEKILIKSQGYEKRIIITDSIFSMDGDIAPLSKIQALGIRQKALVIVDTAHEIGIPRLRSEQVKKPRHQGTEVIMGTLSKVLGSSGGFVAGSKSLINYLRNKARSFIYTTALSPASAAAALTALRIINKNPQLVKNLQKKSKYVRDKLTKLDFNCMESESQIIPILIGDTKKTIEVSEFLFQNGIFASAIRPPTVPKNQSRLRITISATHTDEELEKLLDVFKKLGTSIPRAFGPNKKKEKG